MLGAPTATVTSRHGGEAVNVVPDACSFTLDVRTLPGQDYGAALRDLAAGAGPDVAWDEALVDLPGVATSPAEPFARCVAEVVLGLAGGGAADALGPGLLGVPYFTDGSVLQAADRGCPTVILGPGEPGQAHQTDEYCATAAIEKAAELYRIVIDRWCVGEGG